MAQMLGEEMKPALASLPFVAIRFDRDLDITPLLEETIKDAFFESTSEISLELEFTKKAKLKVWNKPKRFGDKPLLLFSMCYYNWFKKDAFLCIALRNEIGAPLTFNITFLRNLLINLNAKEIKCEIWQLTMFCSPTFFYNGIKA